MRSKRYRFIYGETHDTCSVADDIEREYIRSESRLVDRLNELDEKIWVMEEKLNELGYQLIFRMDDYDMSKKSFNTIFKKHPSYSDKGEWIVMSNEQVEQVKSRFKEDME